MTPDDVCLILDTATRHPTLALARLDGQLIDQRQWASEHRHGEELLQRLDGLLASSRIAKTELRAVICGVGPGSFTGLRIGLATAKVLAARLEMPIVGISTTQALAVASVDGDAAQVNLAVTLPAGAADRYVHCLTVDGDPLSVNEIGPPQLAVPGAAFEEAVGDALVVAVDMDGVTDLSDDAIERGAAAVSGLARALTMLGTKALADGRRDDVARLVPAYVALPRGIARAAAEMTWSPDLR